MSANTSFYTLLKMIDTFNRQSLDTVSDDVLKLGRDLANLKQPQIKCLKTVIQCKDYIFWLREEVKGAVFESFFVYLVVD